VVVRKNVAVGKGVAIGKDPGVAFAVEGRD
jgi:hypothetical protein